MDITKTILSVLNDRQYKKYAILKPNSIKIINLVDSWAKNLTNKKLGYKMFRVLIIFLFLIGSIKFISAEIVDQIIIKGNKRVSKETILVYGKIKKQDYSNSDINNILKNLYSTNFFEDVEINLSNNTLTINLKEYPIVNQLIILGEKSNNKKDQIRKILNLKEKNLL